MKKKTKIIIAVIVVPILLVGTVLYVMGYRGLPVAKTAEEFHDFMGKEIVGFGLMYDLQIDNNGNLQYTLSQNEMSDWGVSWFDTLVANNEASFHIDLKPGGTYKLPFPAESLVANGWDDFTNYGQWYRNRRGNEICLTEGDDYGELIMLRRWGGLPRFNLGGVTNNSNMDDIIEKLGIPYSIEFYPEGSSIRSVFSGSHEVTSDPCATMTYYVFSDGVYQNGYVRITINTAKNAVDAVMLYCS